MHTQHIYSCRLNAFDRCFSQEPKGFNVQGHELRCDSCLGNTANVKNLLEKGAPVDYNHNDGHTSLHMAAGKGYTDIIMLLIEHKASLNIKNSIGDTPLITAALFDGMASVRALVEAGADMKVRGRHNKTAVEHAKAKGKSIIVKYLTSEAPLVQVQLHDCACDNIKRVHCSVCTQ